jgi:hypothetical protein
VIETIIKAPTAGPRTAGQAQTNDASPLVQARRHQAVLTATMRPPWQFQLAGAQSSTMQAPTACPPHRTLRTLLKVRVRGGPADACDRGAR